VIHAENIKEIVADVVTQIDMGLVNERDFWALFDAAKESLMSHTSIVYPDDRVVYVTDVLIGSIIGSIAYEHKDLLKNGEVNDHLKVDKDEE
jgi:hypothetical protein